jgi:hypothetical protein
MTLHATWKGARDGARRRPAPVLPMITSDDVLEKVRFARRRMDELLALDESGLLGSRPSDRQQLLQEFFFHLIGAVDFLGQLVNQHRGLGFDAEDVRFRSLSAKLPKADPLAGHLRSLYANPKKKPLPKNSYSDDAYVFRTYIYRDHVTHRNRNPFQFRLGRVSLLLDPRGPTHGASAKSAQDEMRYILGLFEKRCRAALAAL